MKVQCPISIGELIDKLTILKIKSERITDQNKLELVAQEINELESTLDNLKLKDLESLYEELKKTNETLWEIEDKIRDKERAKKFDDEFISLARAVYITNDQRFEIKNKINYRFGSLIKEVKSYQEY
ncbi:MAG: DUF6165 family protein [Bdellovibrio sp.]